MSSIQAVTYESVAAVTLDDASDLPRSPCAGFHTGSGGDIKITALDNSVAVLSGCAAGVIMPIAVKRIWATGTAATNVTALYVGPYPGNRG